MGSFVIIKRQAVEPDRIIMCVVLLEKKPQQLYYLVVIVTWRERVVVVLVVGHNLIEIHFELVTCQGKKSSHFNLKEQKGRAEGVGAPF